MDFKECVASYVHHNSLVHHPKNSPCACPSQTLPLHQTSDNH